MKINTWISIIALLFSIASFCIACVRCETMEINLVGVLAGILSLPVAVLAIFQAINYFVFEKRIKSLVDSRVVEVNNNMQSESNSLTHAMNAFFMYLNGREGLATSLHGHFIGCLDGLLEDSVSEHNYATDAIMEQLIYFTGKLNDSEKYVSSLKKSDYLRMLANSKHSKAKEAFDFVCKCVEKD